ncbi:MAG: DUF2220 family protein [Eubacteriales bacterium]
MTKKSAKPQKPLTLGQWLIHKYNTKDWRDGKVSGFRKTSGFQDILTILGRQEFMRQADSLEREGYVELKKKNVNTEISIIITNVDRLEELCDREDVANPRSTFELRRQLLMNMRREAKKNPQAKWLVSYYSYVLNQMDHAKKVLPDKAKDVDFLHCLNAISALKDDVWIRQFSAHVLNDSKAFEKRNYHKKFVTIVKEFAEDIAGRKEMVDEELLSEYHLLSYSQTIEYKGSMQYEISSQWGETIIDGADFYYGHIINAQTMEHSKPVSINGVKKIITIENKANYESQVYDENILYIYTHGFMSHKERVFLGELNSIMSDEIEIYHWSDMDYGGMRIFKYMKERIFFGREIKPYKMGEAEYKEGLDKCKRESISEEMRMKVAAMDIPELDELKMCILKYNQVFEQEQQLDWSDEFYDFTKEDSQGII